MHSSCVPVVFTISLVSVVGASVAAAQDCPPDAPTELSLDAAIERGRAVLEAYTSPLAARGILDVTAAPYNATGDGTTNDTCALQHALDDARDARLVVYLPSGTYLVTKTLQGGRAERGAHAAVDRP